MIYFFKYKIKYAHTAEISIFILTIVLFGVIVYDTAYNNTLIVIFQVILV